MSVELDLYDQLVEAFNEDDLVENWDFRPLFLLPARDHDLSLEGGWDLESFAQLGEMSDSSLYALWLRDELEDEECPVVLVTADGEAGVVAPDFASFLVLMEHVGGNAIDVFDLEEPEQLEEMVDGLAEEIDDDVKDFGASVLAELGLERTDPAEIVVRGHDLFPDFELLRIPEETDEEVVGGAGDELSAEDEDF